MRVWETSHLLDSLPAEKTASDYVYDFSDNQANLNRLRQHFRQLKTRLILGLVLGFLFPNALLSAYFHYQFTYTLKNTAKLNLETVAVSQKSTIDLYLQERVVNLNNLFHSKEFSLTPSQESMNYYLQSLRRFSDSFVDVGFFDFNGVQIGYAGPFPFLQGKNYSKEEWYKSLLTGDKNYLISDIYLGLRKIPHFTIATRQILDGQTYIMRASLDPEKLYLFLRSIAPNKDVETVLINREGQYQITDFSHLTIRGKSDFIPPTSTSSGVEESMQEDKAYLVAYSWLNELDWVLLARQPVAAAQAGMNQAKHILTVSFVLLALVVTLIIYWTIDKLVEDGRKMAEKGHQLQEMLAHASKLASIGELAAGVAHEINNPLAIIMATSGVIRDMLNPEFELDHSPEAINRELTVIDSAATRAKGITRKLQDMGKNRVPYSTSCDINQILDQVIGRLKKVEFKSKNIDIKTNYSSDLPQILAEPDPLGQVFGNILINAGDAISEKGAITVTTEVVESMISVTIADTGKGIPPENLKKIFNPFFTTKGGGRGTGLGLSIAASIVKYCGGTIKVNSVLGAGSSFTVLLPIK